MSEETAAWVKEQNKVTFGYLETIPYREEIKNRGLRKCGTMKNSQCLQRGKDDLYLFQK